MIRLSRLSGKEFFLNCELIKFIEATPDTLITLTTGEKLMVKESLEEVVRATVSYKKSLHQPEHPLGRPAGELSESEI